MPDPLDRPHSDAPIAVPDADAWSGSRVTRWLRQVPGLELQFASVSEALFDAAGLQVGETVLDIGCGTGSTTRTAAALVGAKGSATGLDFSADMLEAAARCPGGEAVTWLRADAVTWEPQGRWDVLISRFGIMFFSDPAKAFATLARAVVPGGRLCAAVWAPRTESDVFELPLQAGAGVLRGVDLPPADAGPFSLGDVTYVTELLTGAGWSDVEITGQTLLLPFCGGLPADKAALAAMDFGPLRTIADVISAADRPGVIAAVEHAMAGHVDGDGNVWLQAVIHIVTAHRA